MIEKALKFAEKILQRCQKSEDGAAMPDQEKQRMVWDFFVHNPPPYKDVTVHDMAEALDMDPSQVEEMVYNMFGSIAGGGKSNGLRPAALTDDVLAAGMKVEAEHTANPFLQEKIVYDHIAELGNDYYKALARMEAGLKHGKTEG